MVFGFCIIWRIMEISEGVIYGGPEGSHMQIQMLLQTKNFSCKLKMLLQIKNCTCKLQILQTETWMGRRL